MNIDDEDDDDPHVGQGRPLWKQERNEKENFYFGVVVFVVIILVMIGSIAGPTIARIFHGH